MFTFYLINYLLLRLRGLLLSIKLTSCIVILCLRNYVEHLLIYQGMPYPFLMLTTKSDYIGFTRKSESLFVKDFLGDNKTEFIEILHTVT